MRIAVSEIFPTRRKGGITQASKHKIRRRAANFLRLGAIRFARARCAIIFGLLGALNRDLYRIPSEGIYLDVEANSSGTSAAADGPPGISTHSISVGCSRKALRMLISRQDNDAAADLSFHSPSSPSSPAEFISMMPKWVSSLRRRWRRGEYTRYTGDHLQSSFAP